MPEFQIRCIWFFVRYLGTVDPNIVTGICKSRHDLCCGMGCASPFSRGKTRMDEGNPHYPRIWMSDRIPFVVEWTKSKKVSENQETFIYEDG
jgi:hypothetical protein